MKKTFTYFLLVAALIIFGKVSAQTTSPTGGTTSGLSSTPFGNGFWNVYCYNGHLIPGAAKPATYMGYYTENELSFFSSNRWKETLSPATANSSTGKAYIGDPGIDSLMHTISYKRTGFTPGFYKLDIPWHDNDAYLFINGVQVWNYAGCCKKHDNVWSGYIGISTTIEFKWINFEQASSGGFKMISTNPVALPVDFVKFSANKTGDNVQLEWETASENNNDFFTVEKSNDGTNFYTVTTVKGAGNSSSILTYAAFDKQLSPGLSYYRIKQTDFDQNNSYSAVVCINYTAGTGITVCPNPGNSGEAMYVSLSENNQEVLIVVRDMQGQEYFSKVLLDTESHQLVAINPEPLLAPGMYIVIASSQNDVYSQKIIVK